MSSGCSSARLERYVRDVEAGGSNPLTPTRPKPWRRSRRGFLIPPRSQAQLEREGGMRKPHERSEQGSGMMLPQQGWPTEGRQSSFLPSLSHEQSEQGLGMMLPPIGWPTEGRQSSFLPSLSHEQSEQGLGMMLPPIGKPTEGRRSSLVDKYPLRSLPRRAKRRLSERGGMRKPHERSEQGLAADASRSIPPIRPPLPVQV